MHIISTVVLFAIAGGGGIAFLGRLLGPVTDSDEEILAKRLARNGEALRFRHAREQEREMDRWIERNRTALEGAGWTIRNDDGPNAKAFVARGHDGHLPSIAVPQPPTEVTR
jgi:hypothetical protein